MAKSKHTRLTTAEFDAKFEAGNPRTAEAHLWRAACRSALGRHAEAETELRAVLALLEAQYGAPSWQVAEARIPLAAALDGQGRRDEARAALDAAVESLERERGAEHPMTLTALRARAALDRPR